jgi:hypothetical protein
MADNVAITAGTGTSVAADDIASVFYQRVKLSLGADGSAVDAIAGAGAVGTGVQRVTLASDDPVTAAVQIMDDWDESDRAKVNLIVGQAGIAAGAGAVGATVPRVTLSSDDPGVTKLNSIAKAVEGDYETVAASQTAQVLGGTGASGDFISHILVVPATTSPGNVLLLDNATSITVFAGGASSVTNLVPFVIPLNLYSVSGALKITTGANVSVVAVGSFSA